MNQINFTKIVSVFFLFLSLSVFSLHGQSNLHTSWDELLKKHVSAKGNVNYEGFKKDGNKLDAYVKSLGENMPSASAGENERKAYWVNVYNAFTVKLIVDNLPVPSIKDINRGKPWDKKFIKIGSQTLDLNHVEHKILRVKFNDPRIHAGINCASKSCPVLLNRAFTADNCDESLEMLMTNFVNDKERNSISKDKVELSKIFRWFKSDFTKEGSLIDYLNKYSKVKISPKAKVSYRTYIWTLNN